MNQPRSNIIRRAVTSAGLPEAVADTLIRDAPWLTGEDEVSEELARELLAEVAAEHDLNGAAVSRLVDELNTLVREGRQPDWNQRDDAYEALSRELARHGTEAEYEDGDYWLQPDDGDTSSARIDLLGGFRLTEEAVCRLKSILECHRDVLRTIRIQSAEGVSVIALPPQ